MIEVTGKMPMEADFQLDPEEFPMAALYVTGLLLFFCVSGLALSFFAPSVLRGILGAL